MLRALVLLAALSLALASPVEAKKAPKAVEQTFSGTMDTLAKAGDVIAANRITVRIFNDDKAINFVKALGDVVGNNAAPKATITHVIVLLDERQSLILVFEGEKLLTTIADKPELAKAALLAYDRLSA